MLTHMYVSLMTGHAAPMITVYKMKRLASTIKILKFASLEKNSMVSGKI